MNQAFSVTNNTGHLATADTFANRCFRFWSEWYSSETPGGKLPSHASQRAKRLEGLIALSLLLLSVAPARAWQKYPDIPEAGIAGLAKLIPEKPVGFGQPCANRAAWEPVRHFYEGSIPLAEKFIAAPLPLWDEAAYTRVRPDGSSADRDAMMNGHDGQLGPLVLAECSEWKGRFLPRIAEQIDAISSQRNWNSPGDDPATMVDLFSSSLGHQVAESLYLLGDKIPEATRKRALVALDVHIFALFRQTLANPGRWWWLKSHTNWNAVCLDHIAGAALAALPSRDDRALIAGAAAHYSSYYLGSFHDSGYADEGIMYLGYGFTSYIELREELWQATGGKLDLYDNPKARRVVLFAYQFQMASPNVYADFADAPWKSGPGVFVLAEADRVFGLGLYPDDLARIQEVIPGDAVAIKGGNAPMVQAVMAGFPIPSERHESAATKPTLDVRSYYADAGVLVDRASGSNKLAITIKDGGNGNHSHNDIGSYSIAVGKTQIVGEPGGPKYYTIDSFSSKRYDSAIMNSFGHPVPQIDGHLQTDATKVKTKIVSTDFTPQADTIAMDITDAYSVSGLKRLTRTMHYSRAGEGSIEISDNFDISHPMEIVESFPTHGVCKQIDAKTLQFDDEGQHLQVTIEGPASFTKSEDKVTDMGASFVRIGTHMHLEKSGTIVMKFHAVQSK